MPTPAAAPIEPIEVGEEIECTWGAGIIKEVSTHLHTQRVGVEVTRIGTEGQVGELSVLCLADVWVYVWGWGADSGGRRARGDGRAVEARQ